MSSQGGHRLRSFVGVDANLHYIRRRYVMVPNYPEGRYRCSPSTCAIFCRRRVFEDRGLWFDTRWRAVADAFWLLDTLRAGCRWSVLLRFTSAFADHDANLILSPSAKQEVTKYFAAVPRWVRWTAPIWIAKYRLRMLFSGAFQQKPFGYSIYSSPSPCSRMTFHVETPSAIWTGRA
jgi:hypothetical protein